MMQRRHKLVHIYGYIVQIQVFQMPQPKVQQNMTMFFNIFDISPVMVLTKAFYTVKYSKKVIKLITI